MIESCSFKGTWEVPVATARGSETGSFVFLKLRDKLAALWRRCSTMPDQFETGIVAESISQPPAFGRLLRIFAPAAAIPIESQDANTVARKYRYWQKRVLLTSIVGYATFYFVRNNLSI